MDQTDDPDATLVSSDSTAISLQTQGDTRIVTDEEEYELAQQDQPAETPSSMFITAEQARQMDRDREAQEARSQPRTIPILSIVLFLVGIIASGLIWHWSRPLDKVELLQRINKLADSSDAYEQSVLLDYIEQYQALAGQDDPNLAELAQLKNDLDVQDLERKLRQRARYRLNNSSSLSMIEQVLLDAIHLIPDDPQLAMDRLTALQTLYADPSIKRSKQEQRLLDVADLLKERAQQTLLSYQTTRLKAIDQQLERATQFLQTNPTRSMQVAQAVITLYAEHAWAQERIELAHSLLMQAQAKNKMPTDHE